ncbi:NAD(P)/FAD-dependent oxidoreductase [uncultured Sneathiella sp.]|jgi:L-2-hydroxyglutarate oxidase LhgO|uniref:NAD(P)/FAD-dependent oxidoreductase n=1 Tax=uncultured Sneathiella sp. TaxID=879315 RepID=UPI0030D75521|tara:strand:+ start:2597 stop:3706 length:1110 start_codon:yes stop_codon:yes gene_type:complete
MAVDVENIVIGAGVIGLAIARTLATLGREVLVLEKTAHFGDGTSSRNSEVIHAGIYYPKESLKAIYCVEGKHRLYEYCKTHHVPHRSCGKLIVATSPEEIPTLEALADKAAANDVRDITFLSGAEAVKMEPALHCTAALLSPSTGIIDSHQLMLAYVGEVEDGGGAIAFNAPFEMAKKSPEGFTVEAGGTTVNCRNLINSAGLEAQAVAAQIPDLPKEHIPPRYLTKGSYFTMTAPSPFSRLIYPVPNTASLGIHITLDLAGQIRFGPDQEWVEEINYAVNPDRANDFYAAIRRYFPSLPENCLIPAYSGIRPKVQSPDGSAADFMVMDERDHGLPGLVNLFGMESPGLTASLAIGTFIAESLRTTDRL